MSNKYSEKNNAVWEWVKTYTDFDKLFYNFCRAEDGNKNFIPNPTDINIREYIDGSKLKYYDFAITSFSRFSDIPDSDENLLDFNQMNDFIEWIDTQDKNKNYPKFSSNCNIIKIKSLNNNPSVSSDNKDLAKYMVQCRIEYEEY